MTCLLYFCLFTLFVINISAEAELICGDDEIVDNCPADCSSDYCPTNENDYKVTCTQPDPCPSPTCKCGFNQRRANKTCIPTRSCPPFPCTGPYEEYNSCPPLCPTDNCSQATPSGKCPTLGVIKIVLPCQPKCRCIKGYWRQEDGICVPYAECPLDLICGENEIVDNCPTDCLSDYCPKNENNTSVSCSKPNPCPAPACKCRFNHRRENGTCIPTRSCPPFPCTNPNEEYNSCPPYCPTDKCSQATPTGKCPLPGRIGTILICRPKCRCIKGYWRQEDGLCVPYAECPQFKNQNNGDPVDVID